MGLGNGGVGEDNRADSAKDWFDVDEAGGGNGGARPSSSNNPEEFQIDTMTRKKPPTIS